MKLKSFFNAKDTTVNRRKRQPVKWEFFSFGNSTCYIQRAKQWKMLRKGKSGFTVVTAGKEKEKKITTNQSTKLKLIIPSVLTTCLLTVGVTALHDWCVPDNVMQYLWNRWPLEQILCIRYLSSGDRRSKLKSVVEKGLLRWHLLLFATYPTS